MGTPTLDDHANDFYLIPEEQRKNKFGGSFSNYLDSVGFSPTTEGATKDSPWAGKKDELMTRLLQKQLDQLDAPGHLRGGTFRHGQYSRVGGPMKDTTPGGSAVDLNKPRLPLASGNQGLPQDGLGGQLPPVTQSGAGWGTSRVVNGGTNNTPGMAFTLTGMKVPQSDDEKKKAEEDRIKLALLKSQQPPTL